MGVQKKKKKRKEIGCLTAKNAEREPVRCRGKDHNGERSLFE